MRVHHPLLDSWRLLKCAVTHWIEDDAATAGAALAFYCAFSLAPLLVLVLAVVGHLLGDAAAQRQLAAQLASLFGPSTAHALLSAVTRAHQARGVWATLVSAVALAIGATSVLAALRAALERIWRTRRPAGYGIVAWLRTRLLSFGAVLALGFLLLISLTVSTALATASDMLAQRYTLVLPLLSTLDVLVSLALVAGFFSLLYALLPAKRLRWSAVIGGGLLTAVLFDLGRRGIGAYLAHSAEPSAYGAAASFAALLLWMYYSAQIFLFGAQFTACLGGLHLPAASGERLANTHGRIGGAED
jgi:membrane protein